jgi:transposase-like protein
MSRPVIKFANANSKQLGQLRQWYKTHPLPSHRRRAHAMILSSQGYSPAEVADILDAHPDTIRRWIDHFNEQGCAGLVDQPRPDIDPPCEKQTGKPGQLAKVKMTPLYISCIRRAKVILQDRRQSA